MRSFRDTPIKQKLILISLVSSAAALLLACIGFLVYELGSYRNATLHRLSSVAAVIAANSSAALDFEDPAAAENTLEALRDERKIIRACIYDSRGALFASYHRDGSAPECEATDAIEAPERVGTEVVFSLPIAANGAKIGSIRIRSEPIDLLEVLLRNLEILGLVMVISALASLPLASALQRFISGPILRLVETSKRISAEKDVSVRAVPEGRDELGVLVRSFNEMLEQIETRDRTLSRYRENLEVEVERRTGELRSVNEQLRLEINQRQEAEERTRYLAYYDGLTGLPNRQLFQERLERVLVSTRRRGRSAALLFIDLDRFKQVNDTLGHRAGDELLCEVAARVTRSVRVSDWVARPSEVEGEVSRLGGDEFTVLLTEISDSQDAAMVAQRTLETLAEPISVEGYQIYTTASIGIAVFPFDGEDSETLLRNADTAMYHAKSRHRNNFQFYSGAMNAKAARKLKLAGRLRQAVEQQQLELYYQPLRQVASGQVGAAEALLRWTDPELGRVGPDEFIPIAEETGLIVEIGEWVLRTACTQSRAWQDAGFREIRMAVNISTHQLRHPRWPGTVARILEESGLSSGQLELEVTESAILEQDDATVQALGGFSELGVGLALDDFGTGYSSLSYLRRFPIDRVKIDRSFVKDIPDDREDSAITAAILSMAHSLRLEVVAEGVETLQQADFLCERGCHELQGYLFSPAVPADEFTRFLERAKQP